MSQFHFLTVAAIIVLVVLDLNNCNAGTIENQDEMIKDINSYGQGNLNRRNNPLNWVKKQVKKLKKAICKQYNRILTKKSGHH